MATADAEAAVISLQGVTVDFGGSRPALCDVSLECRPGEFLVLVGESGSGKTTALNVAAGLVAPSTGSVTVLGTDPQGARSRLGYMFARDALMAWRTAQRNVELGLEILGKPTAERRALAAEMLARVGLADAAHKLPLQLSQGMRQRVALARTWARSPEVLLMDEPFSALDPHTRLTLQEQFLTLWKNTRQSVLLVTHDLTEALLLGDRVLVLAGGRVIAETEVPFTRPRDLASLPLQKPFIDLQYDLWTSMRAAEAS